MYYMDEYIKWKNSPCLTDSQRRELENTDETETEDRFCAPLAFGTSGLRGVVGMGINRMNVFTLLQAVRAFAKSLPPDPLVVVCRDVRPSSDELSRAAACALCEQGARVLYFTRPSPTPMLSFAVRHYGASGGMNVTASHNPTEYNGCKFYGSNGAQLGDDDTDKVAALMAEVPVLAPLPESSFEGCLERGQIMYIDCDEEYTSAVLDCALAPKLLEDTDLRVVFSPFHGVGGSVMPGVFERAGLKNVFYEPQQMIPDGTFPTLKNPNPEDPRGFELSERLGKEKNADILVGTDPDADRVAVCVRDTDGSYVCLTGNKTGALLCDYMLRHYRGSKPPVIIKTIVSTHLAESICRTFGAECYSTFTGFKNMAEKREELPDSQQFVMCFEESIGCMIGDHVRDKDGISGSLLVCEMAAWYKSRGMTLLDGLRELDGRYGAHDDYTINIVRKGVDGAEEIKAMMEYMRSNPPDSFLGRKVVETRDYLTGKNAHISGSNVLEYRLEGGSRLLIRPSGTEPKIKIYALTINMPSEALARELEQRLADR
ncbi:MAG: phospho-sugar mutase [Clostridia bacterium]|nr:phospho-sugar mutase [Clostridia bacterium]